MNISIRKFEERDIPLKVNWINNPLNNKYLHYDIPLNEEKTLIWFKNNKDRTDRYDAVIEADDKPIGLIGLLNIDRKNYKAEYYVTIGNRDYLGKGIAYKASLLLLDYAFDSLNLNRIFLYTEYNNYSAQKLFEKIGFKKEGLAIDDLFYNGKYVSRYLYGLTKMDYKYKFSTPLYKMGYEFNNVLYIKRDDLYPFSFGGNKSRKGLLFWNDFKKSKADCIVTYGSSSSNHCRVIANIAASENVPCIIVSPKEIECETFNKKMMNLFDAKIIYSDISQVHEAIETTINNLRQNGKKPYFIQGGGHGNIGTMAYYNCYNEIKKYEQDNNVHFDYIFFASGTGTTQAGLVCGQIINNDKRKIVGISIARKNPYGSNVIRNSIEDFLKTYDNIDDYIFFEDAYTGEGYGQSNKEIMDTIKYVMSIYGIPLDSTYTAKAFLGMKKYLEKNNINSKNILFIHTGGTPLYFNDIEKEVGNDDINE